MNRASSAKPINPNVAAAHFFSNPASFDHHLRSGKSGSPERLVPGRRYSRHNASNPQVARMSQAIWNGWRNLMGLRMVET